MDKSSMDFWGECGSKEVPFTFYFSKKIEDTKKCNDIIDLPLRGRGGGRTISLETWVIHSLRDDFRLKGNYKEKNWQNQKCLLKTRKCSWRSWKMERKKFEVQGAFKLAAGWRISQHFWVLWNVQRSMFKICGFSSAQALKMSTAVSSRGHQSIFSHFLALCWFYFQSSQ